MTPIRAVIFDMDGVLIEAKDWHYEALNRALDLLGQTISRHEHLSTFDGLPTRRKLEILSIERGLPRELHSFINELKQKYTLQIVHAECKPVFQHEFAVSKLKADGMALGVASNSVRASVELMMERSNLLPFLNVLLSNEDVQRAKPAPDIFQRAMERLDVTPQETLILEDNAHGIEAANAAGAHVMVIRTTLEVTYERIARRIRAIEATPEAA